MHRFQIDGSDEAHISWCDRLKVEQERHGKEGKVPEWLTERLERMRKATDSRVLRTSSLNEGNLPHDDKWPVLPLDQPDNQTKAANAPTIRTCLQDDHFQRSNLPAFSLTNTPVAELGETSGSGYSKGSLTPQGEKIAQRAAQNIWSVSPGADIYNQVRADLAFHENRWASYQNLSGSFKDPPVELASSSTKPKIELNPPRQDDQPLLALFEAELAKMGQHNQEEGCIDTNEHTSDAMKAPQQETPALKQSLKALFEALGDLASNTLDRSPELAQRLTLSGQEIRTNLVSSIKTGTETVQYLRDVTQQSGLSSGNPTTAESKHASTSTNHDAVNTSSLGWITSKSNSDHSMNCVIRCVSANCPVRRDIKDLAQRIEAQETKAKPSAEASPQNQSKPSQATQMTIKNPNRAHRLSFEADKILAKRYISYNNVHGPSKKQYLIRWVGHGPEHDVWYDTENLGGCKGLVEQFEKAALSKNFLPTNLSRDELHSIHLRTAGDRMVASRKWEETEEIENSRKFYTDEGYRQRRLRDLRKAHAKEIEKAKASEDHVKAPAVAARASSVEDLRTAASAQPNSQSTLRHRKSWHPTSTTTSMPRAASPTTAAERYPTLGTFEAAHHYGPVHDKGSCFPAINGWASSQMPWSLDYPQVEESRRAWFDQAGYPYPKDKSVRFDLTDPWAEKKLAQRQWQARQKRDEQSLYEAPDATPPQLSKKEGKKPVRYTSPPPPTPTKPEDENSSNQPLKSVGAPTFRRAVSLNFGKNKAGDLEAADSKNIYLGPEIDPNKYYALPKSANTGLGSSKTEELKPKVNSLRRVSSAKLPSKSKPAFDDFTPAKDEQMASTSQRTEKPWPLPEPASTNTYTSQTIGFPTTTASNNNDFAKSSMSTGHPVKYRHSWTFPSNAAKTPASFTATTQGSAEVQKPGVAFTPTFKAPESTTTQKPTAPATEQPLIQGAFIPGLPKSTKQEMPTFETSRLARHRSLPTVPPAVRARSEQIRGTVERLLEMGFHRNEAKTASESVNGDLDMALDILDEDRKARDEYSKRQSDVQAEKAMPGAWNLLD